MNISSQNRAFLLSQMLLLFPISVNGINSVNRIYSGVQIDLGFLGSILSYFFRRTQFYQLICKYALAPLIQENGSFHYALHAFQTTTWFLSSSPDIFNELAPFTFSASSLTLHKLEYYSSLHCCSQTVVMRTTDNRCSAKFSGHIFQSSSCSTSMWHLEILTT